jgi:hypothetical protein
LLRPTTSACGIFRSGTVLYYSCQFLVNRVDGDRIQLTAPN